MTDPSFTKVTNSADHLHSSGVLTRMFYNTITGLKHTLDFATFSALRKSLDILAKIAKCSIFLLSFTFVTFHYRVAGEIHERPFVLFRIDLFLTGFLFFGFFSLTGLLLGHFESLKLFWFFDTWKICQNEIVNKEEVVYNFLGVSKFIFGIRKFVNLKSSH